ncbi:MAG: glycoside hydrolase 5 family protein [Trueperaceae bacterium]
MRDDAFVLGVNYWPRRKAMGWWADFDAEEVRSEFAVIADLGLDVVRVFLLWDDWQPTPDTVSEACLTNLGLTLDAAAEVGLCLDVTFFTGHMSGPNWAPGWLLRAGPPDPGPAPRTVVSGGRRVQLAYRNPFHDPEAWRAAEKLLRAVVGRYRDHPAVWLWNLGNEPDLFAWPASPADGRAWVRRMATVIRELDPRHPITCGLHVESLLQDNGLRVSDVFAETDVAVMHGYPMYADWARGPLDPDYVPFTCALTTALSGKPTLMEEWGGCTAAPGEPSHVMRWSYGGAERAQFMASEDDLADYVAAVLPRLVEVGATGALLWCFADYAEALWERPPCDEAQHERFFGLVRPDGSLKPHAEAVRTFARPRPRVRPANRRVDLDVTPEAYYADPAGHARRLYAAYLADAGQR